jgi:cytoskeleton protein RodZ
VGDFGDKFRKAREKKELSLDDVSNVTKIGSRMLQAIEEEHFDQLPGGVFNKGFIRAYAKHLGLNDEDAVTDYLACLRQAQIDAHEVWEPQDPKQPRPVTPEKRRQLEPALSAVKSQSPVEVEELPELQLPRAEHVRPGRKDFSERPTFDIPWRILAVAVVVIVLAVMLWTRRSHTASTAAAGSSPTNTVQSNTQPRPVQEKNVAEKIAPAPLPTMAAPTNHPTTTPLATNASPQPQASAANPQPPSHAVATATPTAGDTSNHDSNDVTVRTFAKPVPKPPEKSAATLTLVIRATETSWISVLADGQTVSQETLIAPAHTSVRADHEIVARIGNAAGVTFLWNGQEIPADGTEAEVKTFVFDSTGMRVVPSVPNH